MELLIITQNEILLFKLFYLFLVIALVISFIFRKTPLGFLWNLFALILVGLLISVGINFAKDSIKEWWNK